MTEKVQKEIEVLTIKRDSFIQRINIITIKDQTLTISSDSDEMGELKVQCDRLNAYYDSFTKLQNDLLKCFFELNDSDQLVNFARN